MFVTPGGSHGSTAGRAAYHAVRCAHLVRGGEEGGGGRRSRGRKEQLGGFNRSGRLGRQSGDIASAGQRAALLRPDRQSQGADFG